MWNKKRNYNLHANKLNNINFRKRFKGIQEIHKHTANAALNSGARLHWLLCVAILWLVFTLSLVERRERKPRAAVSPGQ